MKPILEDEKRSLEKKLAKLPVINELASKLYSFLENFTMNQRNHE